MAIQLNEEKWRANHNSYTGAGADGTPEELKNVWGGTTGCANCSLDEHYTLAVSATSTTGYTITATPRDGDNQTKDKCKSFVLTITGGTVDKDVSDDATETKERCWQR